jgi:hypothetical protein
LPFEQQKNRPASDERGMSLQQVATRHPAPLARQWLRLAPGLRSAAQSALVALGWALFIASWIKVGRGVTGDTVVSTLLLVVGVTVLSLSVTILWIAHNLSIFRRKGPRTNARDIDFEFDKDFLGRDLDADWDVVGRSSKILVGVREDFKSFVAAGVKLESQASA